MQEPKEIKVVHLPIHLILPNPYQTRVIEADDEIEQLAASIADVDLIYPIVVRVHPQLKGMYEIANGHRRVAAMKIRNRDVVPAFVKHFTDLEMAEICAIENLQRKELNPIEEARSYRILIETFGFNMTQVSSKVGKSRPHVSNTLRLLKLDHFLQECVLCKTLTKWQALIIASTPQDIVKYVLADLAIDWDLTVNELRQITRALQDGERYISWVRNISIENLIDFPLDSPCNEADSTDLDKALVEPILVLMQGIIMDYGVDLEFLEAHGRTTVKAELFYRADWLREVESAYTDLSPHLAIEPGIIPPPTEDKRKRVKLLNHRLRGRKADYPVQIMPVR